MSESRLLRPSLPVFRALPLALQAILIHLLACGLILITVILATRTLTPSEILQISNPRLLIALGEGALASLLSRLAGMPGWWQLINAVFLPAALTLNQYHIAASWYLLGFLALLLTSFGAVFTRVPLYLSSNAAHLEVEKRLDGMIQPKVIDLGCGLGGLLSHLARARPDARLHGADTAPLPWLVSSLRLGSQARIRFSSLWDENLANYDVVYAYLSPAPMPRLWEKVQKEMRPGSLFISNTFAVPGIPPDETVELHDLSHARLLLWRIR